MSSTHARTTFSNWFELCPFDQMILAVIPFGVVFASLGLGEAVYRIAYFQFDGVTDRLPLELLFGISFALLVTREVLRSYRRGMEARLRIRKIKERNERIRSALAVIAPLPVHQQAIRVIREETDRIEWTLADSLPH